MLLVIFVTTRLNHVVIIIIIYYSPSASLWYIIKYFIQKIIIKSIQIIKSRYDKLKYSQIYTDKLTAIDTPHIPVIYYIAGIMCDWRIANWFSWPVKLSEDIQQPRYHHIVPATHIYVLRTVQPPYLFTRDILGLVFHLFSSTYIFYFVVPQYRTKERKWWYTT